MTRQSGDQATYTYLVLSAVALLFVLFSPFSVLFGAAAVVPWYWGDAALTCVAALLMWWRPRTGCLEMFIPFVVTIEIAAFTAARPDIIGPWIPVVHVLALVALVVGWRRRPNRSEAS